MTSLEAAGRSDRTVKSYVIAVRQLDAFLKGKPVSEVTRRDVERFLVSLRKAGLASATVRQRYASLRQWFRWLDREEDDVSDPMVGMDPPKVDEKPVPIISLEQLRKLIASAKSDPNAFIASRDEAIIRLFLDTGIRLDEMAKLTEADIDMGLQTAVVLGKGRRFRTVAFDSKTAEALRRYRRRRYRHKQSAASKFWLSRFGELSSSGIAQMIKRRSTEAGIQPHITPHQFRHTASHQWLASGGTEGDLQQMMGWSTSQMVRRYGSSAAQERAIEAKKRLGMWDEL